MTARIELPVLGKSTSRIGFGTGGLLRTGSPRQRQRILAAALDCGVCHFDTAPIYGFGEAERSLGRALAPHRARITITTKFGLQPSRFAARLLPLQNVARRAIRLVPSLRRAAVRNSAALYTAPGFSPESMRQSLEHSLRALRTDHVDFFLAHQASLQALPAEDLIEALERLRREGKIGAFGVATDFDCLVPVLRERPRLAQVVQFDSDLTTGNVRKMSDQHQLVITYGFLSRSVAECRRRLQTCDPAHAELAAADDETLGGWLLRAAVLANPRGIVLMQSRSPGRIRTNMKAASDTADDERVSMLSGLLSTRS